jgi:capsid protein
MATPPITFLEKKWAAGHGSSNHLIKSATQTTDRVQVSMSDYDTHRNISNIGRRTLMTLGRFMYWNSPPIRGAIDEIARLAVSSYIPQFYGKDRAWGKKAEDFLYESDKFLDVRGWPYTRAVYLQNLVREVLVDGDQGTLLTELAGSAKIQVWRAHRINSQSGSHIVQGGKYDGAQIIDGVVINELGRPIAYAIQDNTWSAPVAYAAANDFLLNFLPSSSDALRGYSAVATAAFPMLDREESKNWLLLAQKIASTYAVQINNETGMADRAKQRLTVPATEADSTTGDAQALPKEVQTPGRVMYFKAGTGQKVEVIDQNQPGENVLNFQEEIIRECLQSMGWSFDFSHNPTKAGGAQMRIVIEKIEARLQEIRDMLVEPVCRRVDGYRVAKAIKSGLLPESDEWFMWTYQGPAKLTADRKYDSEIDIAETARGLSTDLKACARRGEYRDDVYAIGNEEALKKWEVAKEISTRFGIPIETAYKARWENSANGVQPEPPEPAPKAPAE